MASNRKPNGQFLKGTHWRPHAPFRERAFLIEQYVSCGKTIEEIANAHGVRPSAIDYWMRRHQIARRTTSEIRAAKHWGAAGEKNPMFGMTGEKNPRYVDGSSPERQRMYAQGIGRQFLLQIKSRDGFRCVRCLAEKSGSRSLHVHHIKPWAGSEDLRFSADNCVTVCAKCHSWIHSKKNVERELLA